VYTRQTTRGAGEVAGQDENTLRDGTSSLDAVKTTKS